MKIYEVCRSSKICPSKSPEEKHQTSPNVLLWKTKIPPFFFLFSGPDGDTVMSKLGTGALAKPCHLSQSWIRSDHLGQITLLGLPKKIPSMTPTDHAPGRSMNRKVELAMKSINPGSTKSSCRKVESNLELDLSL